MRAFDIDVVRSNGTTRVSLAGEIDLAASEPLADALAIAAASHRIIVDLAQVTFLDASGIGTIVAAHECARARGATLTITRPTPFVKSVMDMVGALSILGYEQHE